MKNKAYENSKLKKQLLEMRRKRVKVVIWTLTNGRKEEIESWGFRVEPFLYSIRTRTFQCIREKPTLLRDLHYMKKRGKNIEVRQLKKEDIKLLKENNIKYYPIKYKIYLQS